MFTHHITLDCLDCCLRMITFGIRFDYRDANGSIFQLLSPYVCVLVCVSTSVFLTQKVISADESVNCIKHANSVLHSCYCCCKLWSDFFFLPQWQIIIKTYWIAFIEYMHVLWIKMKAVLLCHWHNISTKFYFLFKYIIIL